MQADYARTAERIFGAKVRQIRKDRGMSQETLAQHLSVGDRSYHQTTIAKLESGSRPTSVGEVALLAAILGVEVAELFVPTDQIEAQRRLIHTATETGRLAEELATATEQQAKIQEKYAEAKKRYDAQLESVRSLLFDIELPELDQTPEKAEDDGEHQETN